MEVFNSLWIIAPLRSNQQSECQTPVFGDMRGRAILTAGQKIGDAKIVQDAEIVTPLR
jgi:hypothetical protein